MREVRNQKSDAQKLEALCAGLLRELDFWLLVSGFCASAERARP